MSIFVIKKNMNVFYLSLYDKDNGGINNNFPKDLLEYFIDKIKNVPDSVIFFNIFNSFR